MEGKERSPDAWAAAGSAEVMRRTPRQQVHKRSRDAVAGGFKMDEKALWMINLMER
jgi:hypothetical protein